MGATIGSLLPLAVGVAISPIPIIAVILMLLSTHARVTSIGFAVGWVAGIAVATVIFVFVGGAVNGSTGSAAGWITLALGVLLLAEGIREWRHRESDGSVPKWMSAIDEMRTVSAVGIGFALAAINPKNLMMCAAAGVAVGSASLSVTDEVIAVVVFVVIAAVSVVIPVVGYQIAAARLAGPLAALKAWLQTNNKSVMAVLILVIGVVLIGKGIGAVS
ncbi:GAP family protein [Gordonia sp. DT30]|uniref:GAP family protein n=1 Tax=unclassified Gordonia (in: high G+C Gram-positive bacteria) TaxID=2657482 RepID=UPI003CFB3760